LEDLNDFQINASLSFHEQRDDFCDVTLVSEGNHQILAHKLILSASSTVFRNILIANNNQNPLIYFKGIKAKELEYLVDFMYNGEVSILQDELNNFLKLAADFELKGLVEFPNDMEKKEISMPAKKKVKEKYLIKESNNVDEKPVMENIEDIVHEHLGVIANTNLNLSDISYVDCKPEQTDLLIEHRSGLWYCLVCNKSMKMKRDMRRHAEVHVEGVSLPCGQCGNVFR